MPFAALSAPFLPAWVLYEDRHILVVDKPANVSTEAPDRTDEADLATRLRAFLAARDQQPAESVYLRVHQHLERDTSGTLVLARSAEANPSLAEQARSGALRVTFLVGAQGKAFSRTSGQLSAWIARDRSGQMHPVVASTPSAQHIQLTYRVLARQDDRVLAEVKTDRGGARHIRAVIAAQNSTMVAGDLHHKGTPAPRLLMHAVRLQMRHPSTGKDLVLETPAPWVFDAWLKNELQLETMSQEHLNKLFFEAATRRWGLFHSEEMQAFRVLHGEGEGLSGLDIERYGDHLVVWVGEQLPPEARERILDAAWSLEPAGVYLKVRPKHASRIVNPFRQDIAPSQALRGTSASDELAVNEGPQRYWVRLGEGLSTGLFLDQRSNRAWMQQHCAGKAVLNLFAYTCSFTVAAALGGARSTVSVDVSSKVLDTGRRNLELNGVWGPQHELICDDVLRWLSSAAAKGRSFDLIVLDPPSFSTTHRSRFSVTKSYESLATACFALLTPKAGTIIACTNHRGVTIARLKGWMREASLRAGKGPVHMRELPPVTDFPLGLNGEPHMKAVHVEVGG